MAQLVELEELPIRLTAEGCFLHGTTPLHPRVAQLFARNIVPEHNGAYRIELGPSRHALIVDDAAFVVRSLSLRKSGEGLEAIVLHLSDGAQEPLDPATLMQSAKHVLYCSIHRHGFLVPARFTAQQYHTLALAMEPVEAGYALRLGNALWPVRTHLPQSH